MYQNYDNSSFVTKSLLKLELTKTLTSGFEIKIKTLVADIETKSKTDNIPTIMIWFIYVLEAQNLLYCFQNLLREKLF